MVKLCFGGAYVCISQWLKVITWTNSWVDRFWSDRTDSNSRYLCPIWILNWFDVLFDERKLSFCQVELLEKRKGFSWANDEHGKQMDDLFKLRKRFFWQTSLQRFFEKLVNFKGLLFNSFFFYFLFPFCEILFDFEVGVMILFTFFSWRNFDIILWHLSGPF